MPKTKELINEVRWETIFFILFKNLICSTVRILVNYTSIELVRIVIKSVVASLNGPEVVSLTASYDQLKDIRHLFIHKFGIFRIRVRILFVNEVRSFVFRMNLISSAMHSSTIHTITHHTIIELERIVIVSKVTLLNWPGKRVNIFNWI